MQEVDRQAQQSTVQDGIQNGQHSKPHWADRLGTNAASLHRILIRFKDTCGTIPLAALARIAGRNGHADPYGTMETLMEKRTHKSALVRSEIALALSRTVPENAIQFAPVFAKLLEDQHPRVRRYGFLGLTKCDPGTQNPAALVAAHDLLNCGNTRIQNAAAFFLLERDCLHELALLSLTEPGPHDKEHVREAYTRRLDPHEGKIAAFYERAEDAVHETRSIRLFDTLSEFSPRTRKLLREASSEHSERSKDKSAALCLAKKEELTLSGVTSLLRNLELATLEDYHCIRREILRIGSPATMFILAEITRCDLNQFSRRARLWNMLRDLGPGVISPLLEWITNPCVMDASSTWSVRKITKFAASFGRDALAPIKAQMSVTHGETREMLEALYQKAENTALRRAFERPIITFLRKSPVFRYATSLLSALPLPV